MLLQSNVKSLLPASVKNVARKRKEAQLALRIIVGVTKASRRAGRAIVSVSSRKIVSKFVKQSANLEGIGKKPQQLAAVIVVEKVIWKRFLIGI